MKKQLSIYFALLLMLFALASCDKEQENIEPLTDESATAWQPSPQSGFVKAKILYTGDVAVDGLGWVVLINDVYYKPENLPKRFEKNELNVLIKYRVTGAKFQCFCVKPLDKIRIIAIKPDK